MYRREMMKKLLVLFGIVSCIFVCTNTSFAAEQYNHKLMEIIVEIGDLVLDEHYDKALEMCNNTISQYSNSKDTKAVSQLYAWRAMVKSSTNQNEGAVKDYDKAIELSPKDSDLYSMRGNVKLGMGDANAAMEDFNKAIEINPNNSDAFALRACAKIMLGDLSGANSDLNIANGLKETFPIIHPSENSTSDK